MEMLLVTVLVSVTGLAVFQAFGNGIRLWERGIRLDREGNTAMGLDKLGQDLHAALLLSALPFKGTGMRLSFPAVVLAPADKNSSRAQEGLAGQIGAVEYRFEPGEAKIYRRQANYGQALKNQWGPDREVVAGVEELAFQYYFPGDKGLGQSSADGKVPAGVMVEVHMRGDAPDHSLKRFFAIPAGG